MDDRVIVRLDKMIGILLEIRENTKPKHRRASVKPALLPAENGANILTSLWNLHAHTDFPRISSVSEDSSRYKQAVKRWAEKPQHDYWLGVVRKMNDVAFFHGDNDRKWKADFEFFVRPDNHARILEGKFDTLHKTNAVVKKVKRLVGHSESGQPVYVYE